MSEPVEGDLIWCCRSCVEQLKPTYVLELARFVCANNAHACDTCGTETKELSECNQLRSLFIIELEDCRLIITRADVFKYYGIEDKTDAQADFEWAKKLSYEELVMQGRFKLRVLAMGMGLMQNEADKEAFTRSDNRAVATMLYGKLHPKPEAVASDREERIAQGHERRTAKGDEEMKKQVAASTDECRCTSCGCSLVTNLQFRRSVDKLCGECELKHEAEQGTERTVQESLVFARRKIYEQPSLPKRNTRFDPRPGIDDVGLGGSGPNWED